MKVASWAVNSPPSSLTSEEMSSGLALSGKSAIEDHFDVSFELENLLETRNKRDLLKIVRQVSDLIDVSYIRQKEALGLGHAVLRAQDLVGPEPFAVVLADDVIDAETPCIRQLLDIYEFFSAPVLAALAAAPRNRTRPSRP